MKDANPYNSRRRIFVLFLITHSPALLGPASHPPSQLKIVLTALVVYTLSLECPDGQGVIVAGQLVIVEVLTTDTVVTSVDVDC